MKKPDKAASGKANAQLPKLKRKLKADELVITQTRCAVSKARC